MSENKTDLSQSFCVNTAICSDQDSSNEECPNGVCTEEECNNEMCPDTQSPNSVMPNLEPCPGGVCPMPMPKRKMRPPGEISSTPDLPPLNQLFSQLFSSVVTQDGEQKEGQTTSKLADMLKQRMDNRSDDDISENEDNTEDDEDTDDADDEDLVNKESKYSRWDTLNNLVKSHENLTSTFMELLRNDE